MSNIIEFPIDMGARLDTVCFQVDDATITTANKHSFFRVMHETRDDDLQIIGFEDTELFTTIEYVRKFEKIDYQLKPLTRRQRMAIENGLSLNVAIVIDWTLTSSEWEEDY